MEFQSERDQIIIQLKAGIKPRLEFEDWQYQSLAAKFDQALLELDQEKLKNILLVITYTNFGNEIFEALLLNLIEHPKVSASVVVFALGACQLHIVERRNKMGELPSQKFVQALLKLIEHSEPEVVNWALRMLFLMNQSSDSIKKSVRAIKPWKLSTLFNSYKKDSRLIINEMQRSWSLTK